MAKFNIRQVLTDTSGGVFQATPRTLFFDPHDNFDEVSWWDKHLTRQQTPHIFCSIKMGSSIVYAIFTSRTDAFSGASVTISRGGKSGSGISRIKGRD